MAARPGWPSPVGRRSLFQRHHCRRKIRRRVPAQPVTSTVKVAAAEAAPPQAPQPTRLAQTTPQDAAPSARVTPRNAQLLRSHNAKYRKSGAKHRTAQGEPATNGQRQLKSHRRTEGQPGRDKARAREGFGAEPAQDRISPGAAGAGLAQARADGAVAVCETAASNPKGNGSTMMIGSRCRL